MVASGLWACGILGKVHGLHGELYLNPGPGGVDHLRLGHDFFLADRAGEEGDTELRLLPCRVRRIGGTDRRPLVRLDVASTREEALALQGMELLARGGELDDLPHLTVGQLIGLRVETVAGIVLGEVSDVLEAPAHEILEVRSADGSARLVPLVEALVSVDVEAGVARVVDGLLE